MKIRLLHRLQALTALACATLTGCTTTQVHHPREPGAVTSVVRVGDVVRCTLRDGSVAEFEVIAVEPARISGRSRSVPTAEIAQIEIKRLSGTRTALLIAGAAVLVTGVVFVNGRNSLDFPGLGVLPR